MSMNDDGAITDEVTAVMVRGAAETPPANRFDFSKTYYLSGPMAGYPELNFPMFTACAEVLRNSGIKIIAPHELKLPTEPDPGLEGLDYLANDFAVMSAQCQGIILLPGWPLSKGARAELEIALTLKWPVYFFSPTTATLVDMNGYHNA